MKKRIFSLVLALSCMAVLSACGEEETAETEESSTAVEIATVERGSISSESNVSGQVVSDGQESVSVALSAAPMSMWRSAIRCRLGRQSASWISPPPWPTMRRRL